METQKETKTQPRPPLPSSLQPPTPPRHVSSLAGRSSSDAIDINAMPSATAASAKYAAAGAGGAAGKPRGSGAAGWGAGESGGGGRGGEDGWAKYEAPRGNRRSG